MKVTVCTDPETEDEDYHPDSSLCVEESGILVVVDQETSGVSAMYQPEEWHSAEVTKDDG